MISYCLDWDFINNFPLRIVRTDHLKEFHKCNCTSIKIVRILTNITGQNLAIMYLYHTGWYYENHTEYRETFNKWQAYKSIYNFSCNLL